MLHRWLTRRCWTDDAPSLTTAAAGVEKFLREQDPKSSGTEPWMAAERANVFTYHFGQGRGVRYQQDERQILWLCALDDTHAGYEYAEAIQTAGTLYPDLDPAWEPATGTLLAWGEHLDEDGYEWARLIYGALETFEINRKQLEAGDRVTHLGPAHLELIKDEDDIWTLTIRRRLGYLPPLSRRGRWLTNGEVHELFRQIAASPDVYEIDNPPHPQAFLFADIHFVDGPISPADWLARVSDQATKHGNPPL